MLFNQTQNFFDFALREIGPKELLEIFFGKIVLTLLAWILNQWILQLFAHSYFSIV